VPITQQDALGFVVNAATAYDIFGTMGVKDAQVLKTKLADFIRPDFAPAMRRDEFGEAYKKLNLLFDEFMAINGLSSIVSVKASEHTTYSFGALLKSDFIANSYYGTRTDLVNTKPVILKVVRKPENNDLMHKAVYCLTQSILS